jgi:hypothetical protein
MGWQCAGDRAAAARLKGRPAMRPQRAPRYRGGREPETAAGALIQIDGSPFEWLAGRGRLVLVGAIDDATGTVLGPHFRPRRRLNQKWRTLETTRR